MAEAAAAGRGRRDPLEEVLPARAVIGGEVDIEYGRGVGLVLELRRDIDVQDNPPRAERVEGWAEEVVGHAAAGCVERRGWGPAAESLIANLPFVADRSPTGVQAVSGIRKGPAGGLDRSVRGTDLPAGGGQVGIAPVGVEVLEEEPIAQDLRLADQGRFRQETVASVRDTS